MTLTRRFQLNLKTLRADRDLSQHELAERAGISVSYVSMLERGQRTPALDTLEVLAKALKVTPPTLIERR